MRKRILNYVGFMIILSMGADLRVSKRHHVCKNK